MNYSRFIGSFFSFFFFFLGSFVITSTRKPADQLILGLDRYSRTNREHLADVINHSVATITCADCHNRYMNMYVNMRTEYGRICIRVCKYSQC